MSWNMKIVVSVSGEEAQKLLKEYGHCASIYAQHGYSGTMVCCEDEADFDKICEDEDYAEQRLIDTTTNF